MKVTIVSKPISSVAEDYLVLPVFENDKPQFNGLVGEFLNENPKFGKVYETQLLYSPKRKILLVGAGKKERWDFDRMQNWAGTAAKFLLTKTKEAVLVPPLIETLSPDKMLEAIAIGLNIAESDPTQKYKSEKSENKFISVQILIEKVVKEHKEGLKSGNVLAEAINLVRTLGDMPANDMTPSYFLSVTRKIARANKLKLSVLNEKQAEKKSMGAFVGVAKGSAEAAYLIALEYGGDSRSKEKWGLVGKGVTFDSGGISIKPGEGMGEMKYDMCGAAAVLAAMQAISQLELKSNVVGVMAVTENLPSGKALKPGDIVKMYCGKTAEVVNTDAEGRLLLADGLTMVQKDFKATKLIDIATLTGAIIVALGDFYTGVFGNDPKFAQDLIMAGSRVGERYWQLPIDDIFDEMIKSHFADMTNIGHGGSNPRAAGAITGAKFIEKVVENGKSWLHLDIAGTAWDMKSRPYRNPGATGVGVKTLVELISTTK